MVETFLLSFLLLRNKTDHWHDINLLWHQVKSSVDWMSWNKLKLWCILVVRFSHCHTILTRRFCNILLSSNVSDPWGMEAEQFDWRIRTNWIFLNVITKGWLLKVEGKDWSCQDYDQIEATIFPHAINLALAERRVWQAFNTIKELL